MMRSAGYLPIEPSPKLLFLPAVTISARMLSDLSRSLPQCGQEFKVHKRTFGCNSAAYGAVAFGESHAFDHAVIYS
jgi:hypothetical protein